MIKNDKGEKLHKVAIVSVYGHATVNKKRVTYESWLWAQSQIQIDIANLGNTNYQVVFPIT